MTSSPLLDRKNPNAPSVFVPAAMLREARRQKRLIVADLPRVCVLDPDGDILRSLKKSGKARRFDAWPCYHTDLYVFQLADEIVGIVGCVVGAPFAVLVAEELVACGCQCIISLSSAGQIMPTGKPPYFVVIERALRDEGTSHHYAEATRFSQADPDLISKVVSALRDENLNAVVGASWTTDAPFRETSEAIEGARGEGILTVEMEAAALYAFARSCSVPLLCLAHVTNTMGQVEGDFDKGKDEGTAEAMRLIEIAIMALRPQRRLSSATLSQRDPRKLSSVASAT